jgi:hypothetical protein
MMKRPTTDDNVDVETGTEGGVADNVPRQFDKPQLTKKLRRMSQFEGRCFYEVFQVEKDASVDVIRKAYRKLSLLHHPDRSTSPVTVILSMLWM